jgi:hypothetical protein
MSWSGSGTVQKASGTVDVNITASPQSNNEAARQKSGHQIEAAKRAVESIVGSAAYDDGEYTASISGHAHSEGDSKDSCSISIYGK